LSSPYRRLAAELFYPPTAESAASYLLYVSGPYGATASAVQPVWVARNEGSTRFDGDDHRLRKPEKAVLAPNFSGSAIKEQPDKSLIK